MRTITVYVKVPSKESLETGAYNHTFLQLGDSIANVYGFDRTAGLVENKPGKVVDDSWRIKAGDYQAKMTFQVTDEQYNNIVDGINKATKNPPSYNVLSSLSPNATDRQCSMFVNDLLRNAGVETGLTNYENPYTQYLYIKGREMYESGRGKYEAVREKINDVEIDKFIRNLQGLPLSSVEDAWKTYADSGRSRDYYFHSANDTADEPPDNSSIADETIKGAGEYGNTEPVPTACGDNDEEDEEDMYAYSSFYPGC